MDFHDRRPEDFTVRDVCEAYMAMGMDELDRRTIDWKTRILRKFCVDLGDKLVSDCRAIDLQVWLKRHCEYKAEYTRRGILACIKRAFNWALETELLGIHGRNPFARVRSRGKVNRRQPMSDAHFQTFMRFSPPAYRRLLVFLKFSGCRPGEASAMRWSDVHFEQHSVVLKEHKTAKKTGRPRIIPLVPTTAKMLLWMRTHRQVSVVGLLERFLADGPKKATAVARYLRRYGVSDRGCFVARRTLRVIKTRVGGTGPKGYYTYQLPPDHRPTETNRDADSDHVFLTCLGCKLNRSNLALWARRTRKRAGLPDGVSLYCLRHAFGLRGIKNGVNLKLLSLCMGHARTQMTEHYINDAGLTEDMQTAALQIAYGPGAHAAATKPVMPVAIPVPVIPPVEDLTYATEQIPSRAGTDRGIEKGRPQVPVVPHDAGPPTENKLEALMSLMLKKLADTPKKPKRASLPPASMRPAIESAYRNYVWAVEQQPALASAKDREVFDWLVARPDRPHDLPPMHSTFATYLNTARLHYDTRKRVLRPRAVEPGSWPAKTKES